MVTTASSQESWLSDVVQTTDKLIARYDVGVTNLAAPGLRRLNLLETGSYNMIQCQFGTKADFCTVHRRSGSYVFRTAATATRAYSHSMVPGGLLVTSRTTRLISGTSLVMRVEMRSSTS